MSVNVVNFLHPTTPVASFKHRSPPQNKKPPRRVASCSLSSSLCGDLDQYFSSSISVELFFFRRTRQCLHAGRTALNHSGDIVKVTCTHFLLVRHKGVALVARCKLWLLHHVDVVLHAFATGVSVGKLEAVVPFSHTASVRFLRVFPSFPACHSIQPTHTPLRQSESLAK